MQEMDFVQLFNRIGDVVRPNRPTVLGASHWLTDVWVTREGQIMVGLLPTSERPRIRLTRDEFLEKYRFVFPMPRRLLEISTGT